MTEKLSETQLLKAYMDLDTAAQQRVYRVVSAIQGQHVNQDNPQPVIAEADAPWPISEVEEVEQLIANLADKRDIEKIALIDGACLDIETKQAQLLLLDERSRILNANLPLAMRIAVTDYASRSPMMVIGAAGGILLAVASGVRVLSRLVG